MPECEGSALVTFARNENWQDGQGGLARVATSLGLVKVNLIQNVDRGNVVLVALSRLEEFQAMRSIQSLWLMFAGEGNL